MSSLVSAVNLTYLGGGNLTQGTVCTGQACGYVGVRWGGGFSWVLVYVGGLRLFFFFLGGVGRGAASKRHFSLPQLLPPDSCLGCWHWLSLRVWAVSQTHVLFSKLLLVTVLITTIETKPLQCSCRTMFLIVPISYRGRFKEKRTVFLKEWVLRSDFLKSHLRLRTDVNTWYFRKNSSYFMYFKKARKKPADPGQTTKMRQDACASLLWAQTQANRKSENPGVGRHRRQNHSACLYKSTRENGADN